MCEPIKEGTCECKGKIQLICGCGICQLCGKRVKNTMVKKNE